LLLAPPLASNNTRSADLAAAAADGKTREPGADRRLLDVTMGPGRATLESTSRGELPVDVLEAGVRRLALLTLVCSGGLLVVLASIALVARHDTGFGAEVLPRALGCLLPAVVLNVGMHVLARTRRVRPRVVLAISQFYVVLFALALSALR
jgi:hypothetical protein